MSYLDPLTVLAAVPALVIFIHLAIYLVDPYGIRHYPGPFLAKFSDAWLGYVSQQGHRSEVIHELHLKYGPFVRISPSEVSVADPEALAIVYAHGNGALKSSFYDAFVSIERGLFNTRDRKQHARKRKIVSHVFSQKNVVEFEPHIKLYVGMLLGQWDRLYAGALKGLSGTEGDGGWVGRDGRLWLDLLPWANYLAFDIIGDLAFGAPFGMIEAGRDRAPVPIAGASEKEAGAVAATDEITYIPAVAVLNGRGEYSMSMGVLPGWVRPVVRRLVPWYARGLQDVKHLAGIAIVAVATRLGQPTDRVDLLSKLQAGKDDGGELMGRAELTAEALTLLIAGSDTTSNSTCAIIHHLAANPSTQATLQAELDEQLGTEDELVANAEQVKRLPYLDACINEGLRIHSTSALGLPRVVPEGGLVIGDRAFPAGAVLSVPSYSIHRDPAVWGADVEAFRPERWLGPAVGEGEAEWEARKDAMQRAFNPFSVGPRACVGRNLASLELQIIVASIMRRYHFVLEKPEQELQTSEGFLRKPLRCDVGIKRRDV
ncbi:cytochrome P450 monooxygenase [Mycena albidolilacea]|uniref:Cytochrome P450 monooxygenase n=1 Tax=Mycena albidolilacea TaxID=1033008 RepID=A0AAD6ZCA9_9AGAR|nr:cytochrome P450 monooxygenase [Mycena albidolilacea]